MDSRTHQVSASEPRVFNRRLKWTITLITAVAISGIFGFRIADLFRRREQLRDAAERRAANLSLILSAYLQDAFAAADGSLRQVAVYSPRIGGPHAPAKDWDPILSSAKAGLTRLGSFSITDANGIIQHSTIDSIVGQSRSNRYIFKRLSAEPQDVLVIDTPFQSLTGGGMLIPLGRRLSRKDGAFDGMIVATFIPEELRRFLKTVEVGHDGHIWVFHPEGYLMFREPSQANPTGEAVGHNPIFELARSARSGAIRGKVTPEGPIFLSAFQTLDNPRLVVAISLSDPEILAEWRGERATAVTAGSLIIVVMAAILFLLFREIDARSVAEQSLSHVLRLESIGRFTGGVAHDFNNMLTIILGNVNLMRERGAEGHSLDEIEEAAQHAADLTHRLLTFASRHPLQPEILDLNEVVMSLRPMMTSLIGESVRLESHSLSSPCIASIDRVQTESAIMNLCINARDAMPNGGVLKIETGTIALNEKTIQDDVDFNPGRYVFLSATDTGEGIPAENIPRIFEPFFTTKEIGRGTGLGLSTVHGFVKQSGGHVKVQSEINRGTSVTIYFPEAAGPAATRIAKPVDGDLRGAGETILVVEDEEGIRELAEVTLRRLGYNVIAASDGPTALNLAREQMHIDLLLTDIMLPKGMNGYQVAEELERTRPGIRILFASGYSAEFAKTQQPGGSRPNMMLKPYGSAELSRAIYDALRHPKQAL